MAFCPWLPGCVHGIHRQVLIPVYNILEPTCNLMLAHPKYVKAIRGKKTDKKDAKWIADIFKHDLVCGSFIQPYDIRQLRDLCRYLVKLTGFMTGEKNRAQNCLTVSNLQLASIFSDVFGKSASAIIDHLLEHPDDTDFDFMSLVDGRCKASAEDIAAGWKTTARTGRKADDYPLPHARFGTLCRTYSSKQRERRKEKDHSYQQGRSLH